LRRYRPFLAGNFGGVREADDQVGGTFFIAKRFHGPGMAQKFQQSEFTSAGANDNSTRRGTVAHGNHATGEPHRQIFAEASTCSGDKMVEPTLWQEAPASPWTASWRLPARAAVIARLYPATVA
jgi:hypothetical protein